MGSSVVVAGKVSWSFVTTATAAILCVLFCLAIIDSSCVSDNGVGSGSVMVQAFTTPMTTTTTTTNRYQYHHHRNQPKIFPDRKKQRYWWSSELILSAGFTDDNDDDNNDDDRGSSDYLSSIDDKDDGKNDKSQQQQQEIQQMESREEIQVDETIVENIDNDETERITLEQRPSEEVVVEEEANPPSGKLGTSEVDVVAAPAQADESDPMAPSPQDEQQQMETCAPLSTPPLSSSATTPLPSPRVVTTTDYSQQQRRPLWEERFAREEEFSQQQQQQQEENEETEETEESEQELTIINSQFDQDESNVATTATVTADTAPSEATAQQEDTIEDDWTMVDYDDDREDDDDIMMEYELQQQEGTFYEDKSEDSEVGGTISFDDAPEQVTEEEAFVEGVEGEDDNDEDYYFLDGLEEGVTPVGTTFSISTTYGDDNFDDNDDFDDDEITLSDTAAGGDSELETIVDKEGETAVPAAQTEMNDDIEDDDGDLITAAVYDGDDTDAFIGISAAGEAEEEIETIAEVETEEDADSGDIIVNENEIVDEPCDDDDGEAAEFVASNTEEEEKDNVEDAKYDNYDKDFPSVDESTLFGTAIVEEPASVVTTDEEDEEDPKERGIMLEDDEFVPTVSDQESEHVVDEDGDEEEESNQLRIGQDEESAVDMVEEPAVGLEHDEEVEETQTTDDVDHEEDVEETNKNVEEDDAVVDAEEPNEAASDGGRAKNEQVVATRNPFGVTRVSVPKIDVSKIDVDEASAVVMKSTKKALNVTTQILKGFKSEEDVQQLKEDKEDIEIAGLVAQKLTSGIVKGAKASLLAFQKTDDDDEATSKKTEQIVEAGQESAKEFASAIAAGAAFGLKLGERTKEYVDKVREEQKERERIAEEKRIAELERLEQERLERERIKEEERIAAELERQKQEMRLGIDNDIEMKRVNLEAQTLEEIRTMYEAKRLELEQEEIESIDKAIEDIRDQCRQEREERYDANELGTPPPIVEPPSLPPSQPPSEPPTSFFANRVEPSS